MFSELDLLASYPFKDTQPILVDVGAHHGFFSSTFARQGWQIVAFEPEQKNRAAFEHNMLSFKNVVCVPKAVSDVSGKFVPFYTSNEHYGIHSLKPFHRTHQLAYQVETTRLDDILQVLNINKITLLKVDTEGADFLAIKSLDFGVFRPELIMIEFMDDRSLTNFGYSHHDVVAYMKEKGYNTFVSEWAPIKEYGREGVVGESHTWLQCVPYPTIHKPAWGNLIFVPNSEEQKFNIALGKYLDNLEAKTKIPLSVKLRRKLTRIPGIRFLYNLVRGK